MKRNTGVTIDEDLVQAIDKRRAISPGSSVKASRSTVINDLLRRAVAAEDGVNDSICSEGGASGAEAH